MAEEKKSQFEISNRLYALVIILILGLIITWGVKIYVDVKGMADNFKEVTINGQGSVLAKPDVALLKVSVVTKGSKVQDVVKENTQKMDAVTGEIKGLGIEEKDIETVTYDLASSEDGMGYDGEIAPQANSLPADSDKKEGASYTYTLTNELKVKIRDFSKIASIMAKATEKGANGFSSLQYIIENPDKVRADATKKAIEAARAKADFMARQSGLRFKKLVNIYEDPYQSYGSGYGYGGCGDGSLAQMGQQEIISNVQLTYRVK